MQSATRTALRSAVAASRQLLPRAAPTSFAAQALPKAALSRQLRASPFRLFSSTARARNVEEAEKTGAEIAEAGKPGSEDSAAASEVKATEPTNWPTPHAIFVRNIIFDATEEDLITAFSKYGEVAGAHVSRQSAGVSRGFGFVYFKHAESVRDAVANCDGTFWHGRRIGVAPRTPPRRRTGYRRAPSEPSHSIYIGNIPFGATDADLNQLFRPLQNVKVVRVAVDRATGWPRGFAHVDFTDVESARIGKEKLEGAKVGNRTIRVDFAAVAAPYSKRDRAQGNGEQQGEQ